ncbi:MAG TPA: BON domain-containing protein [Candidatus Limnocylindria bacterium]|nr:BON domain-containing protein [Candidatus Limnocylindria bacterium]
MNTIDRWREQRLRTDQSSRRGGPPGMLLALLGAAAGAVAAYLLDPERGKRRRAVLVDQARARMRDVGTAVERGSRRAGTQAFSISQQVAHRNGGNGRLNDSGLSDKVETELFADPSIPQGKININVEEGVVVLRGEVDNPGQREELIHKAEAIAGVVRVDSLLHLPGEPVPPEPPRAHPSVSTAGPEGTLP